MSGDQQASSSVGNPDAQPPTPKQTPTSVALQSPVFHTPKNRQGPFSDSGSWTPRFAEEYSVFNSTPGNLRGSQGPFADFASITAYPLPAGHKRQLSVEEIAAQIAAHDNHFSPNSSLPLPPVDPSQRLQSTPRLVNILPEFSEEGGHPPSPKATPRTRSAKKAKKGGADTGKEPPPQTATPPPSSRKGSRKLARKPKADNMQDDQGYGQPDFTTGTPQQPGMTAFAATDMFGYPMSAPPASGTNFWDPGADMSSMDLDFSTFGSDVFQAPTPTPANTHRSMNSFDANQMFQDAPMLQQEQQQQQRQQQQHQDSQQRQQQTKKSQDQAQPQPPRRERPLAPKPRVETKCTAAASVPSATYTAPISDDPFGIVSPGGGVNPGLLFSRPQSSNMDTSFPTSQGEPTTQASMAHVSQVLSKGPMKQDIRHSNSTKDKLPDRALASSPIKASGRPGLQRSFSENRGKRGVARGSLPALAPATRPTPAGPSSSGIGSGRAPGTRASGRISPLKNHHRLSSLTSIPEATPRTRTSVKFTIDSLGRARAETTVVVDGDQEAAAMPASRRRPSHDIPRRREGERSNPESEDDESSTDDEPIIIPSRNTSFALPDPRKPSPSGYHTSHRSISDRSTGSFATGISGDGGLVHDVESEAETVMAELRRGAGRGGGGADAASELQKLVKDRQRKSLGSAPRGLGQQQRNFGGPSSGLVSPTTLTDASSLLTPSTNAGGGGIRCICHQNEAEREDGFMVQCESCELWLHGQCIKITSRRNMPSVYICAFCANTPNVRGGRLGDAGRGGGPVSGSPLAHKSFKSFR